MRNTDKAFLFALVGVAILSIGSVKTATAESSVTTLQTTVAATTEETIKPTQTPTKPQPTATQATVPPQTEPEVILYDIPLDEDLQLYIIGLCEEKHIDPAVIMAMIWRESSYNPSAIGDGGDSLGLMQIQPKWNYQLMDELGCQDLLDPYQNVTVGIAVLAEKFELYGDMAMALVGYNSGWFNGIVTNYANDVLEKAEELRGNTYVLQ